MRVETTEQAAYGRTGGTARDAAPAVQHSDSRALVVQAPAAAYRPPANYRQLQSLAAFLAQLIATKDQAPQTRERRRAEPGDVIAAYRAVEAMTGH